MGFGLATAFSDFFAGCDGANGMNFIGECFTVEVITCTNVVSVLNSYVQCIYLTLVCSHG